MTPGAEQLDQMDTLAGWRDRFILPADQVYLDGNSLGPMLHDVRQRLISTIDAEWAEDLITSWNKNGWMELPIAVGEKIAPLLGAKPGQVICTDNVSVNLFKLLATAVELNPDRRRMLSVDENFPTDHYMLQGLVDLLGEDRCQAHLVSADNLLENIDAQINLVVLSHVNFRTGSLYDLEAIIRKAHEHGAMLLLDVSHSVGVVPLELDRLEVDFAVGCGYKFLNGGPGAPAFLYVAERHQNKAHQPLSGWMGHVSPFEFVTKYRPAPGINRYQSGTPGILGMAALDAAMAIWSEIDILKVREKSLQLTGLLMEQVAGSDTLDCLRLETPLEPLSRSSQVSFAHEQAFEIVQALIEAGIVCDYREPNLIRMGVAPLYIRFQDISRTVACLVDIVGSRSYRQPGFRVRKPVT